MQEGEGPPSALAYHPVVTVLADPRPEDQIHRGLQAVAKAVATGTGIRLEQVWVHWVDLPASRTFSRSRVT